MSVWNTQQPWLKRSSPSRDLPPHPPPLFLLLLLPGSSSLNVEASRRDTCSLFPQFLISRSFSVDLSVIILSFCIAVRRSCNPSSSAMQSCSIFAAKCAPNLNAVVVWCPGCLFVMKAGVGVFLECWNSKGKTKTTLGNVTTD